MTDQTPDKSEGVDEIRSLKDLLDRVSGRSIDLTSKSVGAGLYDQPPFPFLAIVGQEEMKLALLLAVINPAVGGVLLVGPRGTGKTTAVRGLADLLPDYNRSFCAYGCTEEDIEERGIDQVCERCAQKYGRGEALTGPTKVRLVELPLNATLAEVIGRVEDPQHRYRVRQGILAQADKNLLYIDEVNLLGNTIVDAVLDASAQGNYTVRHGGIAATYYARFMLVGSMNPEEGQLRPQIMDRFGLRVIADGLNDVDERFEAYKRVQAYRTDPFSAAAQYIDETQQASQEIQEARKRLTEVIIPDVVAQIGLGMIKELGITSLRAEITMFEAARAHAAADGRLQVTALDLQTVAPMALRLRRSDFYTKFYEAHKAEEDEIIKTIMPQTNKENGELNESS